MSNHSPYLSMLKDRIDLTRMPFTDCGSRLLVYGDENQVSVHLAWRRLDPFSAISQQDLRQECVVRFSLLDTDQVPLETQVSTYPHCMVLHTRLGDFTLAFQDTETLLVAPPAGSWAVRFDLQAQTAQTDSLGGILHVNSSIQQDVAYSTNARIQRNHILPAPDGGQRVILGVHSDPGQVLLLQVSPRVGKKRTLPDPDEALQAAGQRWHAWFAAVPFVDGPLQAHYYYAWWVLRSGIISPRQLDAPEASSETHFQYPAISYWDAYFHALAYRHIDPSLAQDQLRALLDQQQSDGMLPVTGGKSSPAQPLARLPLLAWTAWKLYTATHDRQFLADLYPGLVRCNRWWFEHADPNGNGLCEYTYPHHHLPGQAAPWEQAPGERTPLESPDLNSYIFLQQEALGNIAQALGYFEQAQQWNDWADRTARRMLALLWDEQAGMFWPRQDGRPVRVRTPLSLLPLLTGRLPQPVSRRLVANLTDPQQFWTRYPVPGVALNDPHSEALNAADDPGGSPSTWAHINYLLIEGLFRSGFPGLGRELRHRTLEYLSVQAGQEDAPYAPAVAAIFIDLAIQDRYERVRRRSNSISAEMRRTAG